MAMIERAMKMVFPFGPEGGGGVPGSPGEAGGMTPPPGDAKQAIDQVKRQLDALQRQLDGLVPAPGPAMRAAAVLLRGSRDVAAIRSRLSGILSGTGAAARSQHRHFCARSDAGTASDLQRVGSPRHLLRSDAAWLFRDSAQGTRGGENPTRLH